jgi:HlyD family secretion protein
MSNDPLEKLRIASHRKTRSSVSLWLIIIGVAAVSAVVVFLAIPRASDSMRSAAGMKTSREAATARADKALAERSGSATAATSAGANPAPTAAPSGGAMETKPVPVAAADGSILTVSGYIIARERIEISPRFMGVVNWIGVKKGDAVTNGQVVVTLDDAEYRARLAEIDGQRAVATVAVERARTDLRRAEDLVTRKVEMDKTLDDARFALASAEAQLKQIQGARQLIETYLEWCTIRSPVNGVVLEKLVEPNELVTPQTFGGSRGPSTSLVAVADLQDLQVEIDVNESDLAKIGLGQTCKVSPEAFRDKQYDAVVAEIAPEASRQKGTLQVKVQIKNPDRFLTPELSARVVFYPKG